MRAILAFATSFILIAIPGTSAAFAATTAGPASNPAPVMMILDASGSMAAEDLGTKKESRMEVAKNAATAVIDGLKDDAEIGLMTYGTGTGSSDAEKSEGCKDISVLQPVGQVDKTTLKDEIKGIQESGYTPIGAALEKAAAELPDDGPRGIVLLSDGEDTCAPPPPCEVAEKLAADGADLAIHSVGLKVDEKTKAELECISEATGGTYSDAGDTGSLQRGLQAATETALKDYDTAGASVVGGSGLDDATSIKPGQYLDTLDKGGKPNASGSAKTYRITLDEGQRAFFGATLVPKRPPGGANMTAYDNQVKVNIVNSEGDDCLVSDTTFEPAEVDGGIPPTAVVETSVVGGDSSFGCFAAAGEYVVEVERSGGYQEQFDTPFPLELTYILQDGAQAAATPPSEAKPSVSEFLGEPGKSMPVAGGQSFNSATLLEAGTYSSGMTLGETQYFKVPVLYGQQLRARVDVPGNAGWESGDMDLRLTMFTPLREQPMALRPGDEGTAKEGSGIYGSEGEVYTGNAPYSVKENMAFPVDIANRDQDFGEAESSFLSGYYYVAVGSDPRSYSRDGRPEQVNFTLQVDTVGEAKDGPDLAGAGIKAPPPEAQDDAGSAAFGLSPMAWTGLSLGGLLLVAGAVVATVLLARSRRG